MKKKTISQLFLRFIKEENIYDKVMNAYSKHNITNIENFIQDLKKYNVEPLSLLSNVRIFCSWMETEEGFEYWQDVNVRWVEKLFDNSDLKEKKKIALYANVSIDVETMLKNGDLYKKIKHFLTS